MSLLGRHAGSGDRWPGFPPWLCHLLAVCPLGHLLKVSVLSFLIYKIVRVVEPPSGSVCGLATARVTNTADFPLGLGIG
jgi:hypothetical protein